MCYHYSLLYIVWGLSNIQHTSLRSFQFHTDIWIVFQFNLHNNKHSPIQIPSETCVCLYYCSFNGMFVTHGLACMLISVLFVIITPLFRALNGILLLLELYGYLSSVSSFIEIIFAVIIITHDDLVTIENSTVFIMWKFFRL